MKALLLAAGFGTRLGNLTKTQPKCLIKVGNETMLDHWLFKLEALGVSEFIINTHYLADQVDKHILSHPLKDKINLSYEPELLGTAGTLSKHSKILKQQLSFIVHVDNFCVDDLNQFLDAHQNRPTETMLSMLTFKTSTPEKCGIVEMDGQNRLVNFHEKIINPPTKIANAAVYISTPMFIDFIENLNLFKKDISLDIIPLLLGKIFCYNTGKYFKDVGSPETLYETVRFQAQHSKAIYPNR